MRFLRAYLFERIWDHFGERAPYWFCRNCCAVLCTVSVGCCSLSLEEQTTAAACDHSWWRKEKPLCQEIRGIQLWGCLGMPQKKTQTYPDCWFFSGPGDAAKVPESCFELVRPKVRVNGTLDVDGMWGNTRTHKPSAASTCEGEKRYCKPSSFAALDQANGAMGTGLPTSLWLMGGLWWCRV